MHELQNVHEHRKKQYHYEPDGMNYSFDFPRHGLAEYPFYKTEYYLASVKRGNGQKIENRKIDPNICRDFKKTLETLHGYLRSQFYRRDGSAHRRKSQPARKKFAKYVEDSARYFKRINERMPQRFEKSVAIVFRAYIPIRNAVA